MVSKFKREPNPPGFNFLTTGVTNPWHRQSLHVAGSRSGRARAGSGKQSSRLSMENRQGAENRVADQVGEGGGSGTSGEAGTYFVVSLPKRLTPAARACFLLFDRSWIFHSEHRSARQWC